MEVEEQANYFLSACDFDKSVYNMWASEPGETYKPEISYPNVKANHKWPKLTIGYRMITCMTHKPFKPETPSLNENANCRLPKLTEG